MTTEPQDNPSPDEPVEGGSVSSITGKPVKKSKRSSRFFIRGMATLLPAVLTLWLLVFAYGFIRDKIASPINWGIQGAIIQFTDWPKASDEDYVDAWDNALSPSQREEWELLSGQRRRANQKQQLDLFRKMMALSLRMEPEEIRVPSIRFDDPTFEAAMRGQRMEWMKEQPEIVELARRAQLQKRWNSIALGNWHILDLIGLIVAIILFYFAGVIMSNVIGRQLKDRGEKIIDRVPLIRRVYPAVKQITDFFFGDSEQQLKFNRVVAVEYPRKGIYSVGLVTGDTMQSIETAMGETCLTVFVPSSPTPFTGYVITVPEKDTIDLGITIEDALKFAVSGGVLVPTSQLIKREHPEHDRRGPTGDRRGKGDAGPDWPAPSAGE